MGSSVPEQIEKCRHLASEMDGPKTTIYAMHVERGGDPGSSNFTGGGFMGDWENDPTLVSVELALIPELAARYPDASHVRIVVPNVADPESARATFEESPGTPHENSYPIEIHPIEVPDAVFNTYVRLNDFLEPIEGPNQDLYEALWHLDGYFLGEGLFGLYNNTYGDIESDGPHEKFLACVYAGEIGGAGKLFVYTDQTMWIQ